MPASVALGGARRVVRLGFGAMRITGRGIWGEPPDRERARSVLRRAVELGVELIDTADSYGPAVSEELIAEALHPYPAGLAIATKAGLTRPGPDRWEPDGRPEHLRAACEGSLRRLRVDRVDLLQLHRPDPDVPLAESIGALAELQREGKVAMLGVSNVTASELAEARSEAEIVSVQNRMSVLDRGAGEVLEACERDGLAFLAWAPLASGAAGGGDGALAGIAEARGVEPAQVALAWLLARSPVIVPIPGTGSVEHLEANVAAASLSLEETELEALSSARPSLRRRARELAWRLRHR